MAISLETAIQNTGMAYFILSLSFPSPLAEIGLVPVISFFFCSTGPILLVVYAFYEAYKKLFLPSPIKPIQNKAPPAPADEARPLAFVACGDNEVGVWDVRPF